MKKTAFILSILLLVCPMVHAQTITQISFIIKKAIPEVENIAVIYPKHLKSKYVSEARTAQLVSRKNISIYGVSRKSEIASQVFNIRRLKNVVVIVMTDNSRINADEVKYIIDKLAPVSIPVVSNRDKDTLLGALLSVFLRDNLVEKHLNQIVASALNLNLSDTFLKECIVDVE